MTAAASIDKNGYISTNSFIEDNNVKFKTLISNSTKTVYGSHFIESYITESDGSVFLQISNQINPSANLFLTASKGPQVFHNSCAWSNFAVCNAIKNSNSKIGTASAYEFLAIQQPNLWDGTFEKFRWKQKYNPIGGASFSSTTTAASNSANFEKVTPEKYTYTTYGGIYDSQSGGNPNSCYVNANNGANGNWFGAFGMYVNTWNTGAIPGYNGKIIRGSMRLYVRIDNTNLSSTKFSVYKNMINTYEFVEA